MAILHKFISSEAFTCVSTGLAPAIESVSAGATWPITTLHSSAKTVFIFLDRTLQSQIQRVTNQRMPDGHLVQPRNVLIKIIQIHQAQIMSGIQPRPKLRATLAASTKGATAASRPLG